MSLGLLTSSIRVLKNLKTPEYDRVLGLVTSRLIDTDGDFSHLTKRRSRLQLVLLSCAVCGIEFCYAAETAFVSPTLLKIGVPVLYMTLIWCLSPFMGLFLLPLLGSLSDRSRSRMGRRRPFILLLSVGIIIGLLLVPNGKAIGQLLGDNYAFMNNWGNETENSSGPPTDGTSLGNDSYLESGNGNTTWAPSFWLEHQQSPHPWSILFTVIGVVLLDFSCDSCQSPCRAYLLDVTLPEDHSPGLTTFTVMAGLGGSLGYVMGGVDWQTTTIGETVGDHVRVVFSMVLVIYLVCLMLTISAVKEIPLDKLGVTKEELQKEKKKVQGVKYRKFANESDSEEEGIGDKPRDQTMSSYGSREHTVLDNGPVPTHVTEMDKPKQNGALPPRDTEDSLHFYQASADGKSQPGLVTPTQPSQDPHGLPLGTEVSLGTYLLSIVHMPHSLAILCVTNLFCWMSLVCYSLYFTDFVGQAVYGGDPRAPPDSLEHALYEKGVRVGSIAMSLYSFSCACYSLSIEKLVKTFGAKRVYILSQLVYTVGATLMAITCNKVVIIILSPCAGVMYATLFTMPYILVAHYHSNDTFEETLEGEKKADQKQIRGLGTDIALVSSMVFFAQFLQSSCMGSIIHLTGTTASVMAAAAILSFCGSIAATRVVYLDM